MGVKISGEFIGSGKVRMVHESGDQFVTMAPKDNGGDGSKFSPTDLVVSGLGSCILTIMSFVAKNEGINFEGVRFEAEKIMQTSPRMIDQIPLTIYLPKSIAPAQRKKLEKAAMACPVKRSLSAETKVELNFIYNLNS
jgi:putative redox protein